jgi:Carboxypeptidase regulatory-like domain
MKRIIIILLLVVMGCHLAGISFGPRIDRGMLQNDELSEASGLAVSGWDSGVLWTHNDSGGETAIYACSAYGEHLGKYYLEGITFRDVEDIASGAGPEVGINYLYLADIGDNNGVYAEKYIYRVREPEVDEQQLPGDFTISAEDIDMIAVAYPGGELYDAETVFIDNLSGDIYLVSKRNQANPFSGESDIVYRADYPQSLSNVNVLVEVSSLNISTYQGYGITGGDLSSSGLELLLKTYDRVYYWGIEPGEDLVELFAEPGSAVNYELEPQGEAICWDGADGGYFSCGEEYEGYPSHLSYYARYTSFIEISQLPAGLYKTNESIEIIWGPAGLYNQLYTSSMPGGYILDNYESSGVWGEDILISSAGELGLGVGVYRGILHNPEYDYISIDFPLIVESSTAPQMVYPPNGGTISEPLPVFQWQVNAGVPYYLLAISDTPFIIEHDEDGETVVSGIETIWQVITYDTSIMYGMPDPSGYFTNSAPPLIPGQEYNWIVANNYGNDPLLTSKVAGNPYSFYYSAEETIESAELTAPAEDELLWSTEINFSWTEVNEAMYYQVQVFEIRQEGSNIGNYLVWDQVTTNTDMDMNASAILIESDYTWKVYATSAGEISSVSEAGHFGYDIAVGTLELHVRDNYGSSVSFATAELDPIDGSSDDFPLAVNANGNESKEVPVGEYYLEVSKAGYEAADTVFVINEGEATGLWVILEYSPSSIYGRVADQNGYNISNVTIKAESEAGEERQINSINGNYQLPLTAGEWTVWAEKTEWMGQNVITAFIEPGENLAGEELSMVESEKDVQGYVFSSSGIPLMRTRVTLETNESFRQIITDANGYYQISGLTFGEYTVSGSKAGYTALNYETVNITAFSPAVTTIADLILQPSSMINGTARNGLVGLKQVVITAIPAMGDVVETITDEYGDYQLNLVAGTYYIGAHRAHYTNQTTYQVSLSTGETLDNLDFILLPNDAIIRGRVDSEGERLAAVRVWAGENETYTDNNGEYELIVYPGSYDLFAYSEGYTTNRSYQIALAPDEVIEAVDFVLYPNASVIRGRIHHEGLNIAGAEVFARKESGNSGVAAVVADLGGEYSFSLLHGSYTLWAEKTNFVCLPEDSVEVTIAPGEVLENVDINLTPVEAYVSGQVVSSMGLGIAGALIEVISGEIYYSSISGNYGNFRIVVEPDLDYLVLVSKVGYSSGSEQTGILEIGEEVFLEIILSQLPSTIAGRVFNQHGVSLQGVSVTAAGETNYETETGLNGSWLLSVYAGTYQVTAAKPGYLEDSIEIDLVPGTQLDSLDFYLAENYAILEGYVVDENTGESVGGVLITATYNNGGGNSGYSNIYGYYRLEDLLPGVYESIIYSREGYYTYIEANTLLPGSFTTNINVLLEPFVAAVRSIVRYQGVGLGGVTVAAENLINYEVIYDVTDEAGVSIINDLASLQPYEISVSLQNYTSSDTIIYAVPGDTLELEFDLIRVDGLIYGFVRDQGDNGVAGASVTARSEDGFETSGVSASNGAYLLEDMAVDRSYEVTAARAGYSQYEAENVYLTPEPYNLDLVIYEHNYEVTGVLVDQAGYVLPGIQVNCQGEITGVQTQSGEDGSFILSPLAPFSIYNFWTLASENGYENISWQTELIDLDLDLGEVIVPVHISTIWGVITDEDTGEPLAGVVVSVNETGGGQTSGAVSQPDGSYRIRYLYEGIYTWQAQKSGYADVVMEEIYLGHREDMVIDIEMEYTQPLEISGMVKDTDNRMMADIAVDMICGDVTYSTLTDIDGNFWFEQGVPYSELIVTTAMNAEDYDNNWVELVTTNGDITDIILEIDVHNAELSGQVTDGYTPLGSVEISLVSVDTTYSMITGANGYYYFDALYEGLYELSGYRPGYEMYNESVIVNDGDEIIVNIVTELVAGTISGVVSSVTEAGIRNAIVTIRNNDEIIARDTTHISGAFQLDELPANQLYEVSVQKTGFMDYIYPDSVAVDSVMLELIITPWQNSLSGTVFLDEIEVTGARVVIRDQEMEIADTETDEFGDYLFSNLNGYRDVWAEYGEEYTSISEGVDIPVGGSVRYHPELIDAASIEGLCNYLGEPKPGVSVTATNISSGRWARDITEQDGLYELRGLAAGSYNLSYYCEGYTFSGLPGTIVLAAGEDVNLAAVNMTFMQNSISGIVQIMETRIGISGAEVVLSDSLHNVLEESLTGAEGTFLYSPLSDGIYYVEAEHPAYEEAAEIEVVLTGGVSEPATVDFNLIPRELIVYGNVHTDGGIPVYGAEVTVEMIESVFSRGSGKSKTLAKRSLIDTTDSSGYYEVLADTIGFWQITVDCEGYYPAQPVTIELSWTESYYQQDFYMQPIIFFADICGTIRIWDEGWQPADSFSVRLQSETGLDSLMQQTGSDSTWCFQDIVIPGVFSLEVNAEYNEQPFHELRESIEIELPQVWNEDFTFTYIPERYTWYGNIYMQTAELEALENANLVLESSSGDSLIAESSSAGYYNFSNLAEDDYRLHINTEYDNESFSASTPWQHIAQNYQYSHVFQYILAELGIYIRQPDNQSLPDSEIRITGEDIQIVVNTNSFGYCSSGAILHTGEYELKLTPPGILVQQYLPFNLQHLQIDSLGFYQCEYVLPVWFDKSDYALNYQYDAEIPVYLYKTIDFSGSAVLYYRTVNGSERQLEMNSDYNRFYQTIPAQLAAGEIEFWFSVQETGTDMVYSNPEQFYTLNISTAGIPSAEYSILTPANPVLPYNSEIELSLIIKDELGNILNDAIAEQAEVIWNIDKPEMGSLVSEVTEPLTASFQASTLEVFEVMGTIRAEIDYEDFHLNLETNITTGNYEIADLQINGALEVDNNSVASYNIQIYSQTGRLLSLPWNYQAVAQYAGQLHSENGFLVYTPDAGFIGRTNLVISVIDPLTGIEHFRELSLIVYDMINAETESGSLTTGEGCDLLLHDNMLKNAQLQAKLYLLSKAVPPFEETGVQYETDSAIFEPNSDQPESAFEQLPGLQFMADANAMIARWDAEKLSWQVLSEGRGTLQHIDILAAHYSVLKSSDELGIYDLKLLPNPFTPHDIIGSNMGLQIQFRLSSPRSRYITITARVYNMTGQLVREIARREPLLKGEHTAGEVNTLYWDGYTDGGRLARNGRYLVHLIAEDSEKKQELLKSIVLIK